MLLTTSLKGKKYHIKTTNKFIMGGEAFMFSKYRIDTKEPRYLKKDVYTVKVVQDKQFYIYHYRTGRYIPFHFDLAQKAMKDKFLEYYHKNIHHREALIKRLATYPTLNRTEIYSQVEIDKSIYVAELYATYYKKNKKKGPRPVANLGKTIKRNLAKSMVFSAKIPSFSRRTGEILKYRFNLYCDEEAYYMLEAMVAGGYESKGSYVSDLIMAEGVKNITFRDFNLLGDKRKQVGIHLTEVAEKRLNALHKANKIAKNKIVIKLMERDFVTKKGTI